MEQLMLRTHRMYNSIFVSVIHVSNFNQNLKQKSKWYVTKSCQRVWHIFWSMLYKYTEENLPSILESNAMITVIVLEKKTQLTKSANDPVHFVLNPSPTSFCVEF